MARQIISKVKLLAMVLCFDGRALLNHFVVLLNFVVSHFGCGGQIVYFSGQRVEIRLSQLQSVESFCA